MRVIYRILKRSRFIGVAHRSVRFRVIHSASKPLCFEKCYRMTTQPHNKKKICYYYDGKLTFLSSSFLFFQL